MKLYYSAGACSLGPRIAINEIGLTTEYEAVDLKTKKTEKGEDFYKINPKGAVPVLQLDNKEILTEAAVILQYLANENPAAKLLPTIHDAKRYQALEWLNFVATDMHKGVGVLFNPKLPQEVKDTLFIPLIKNKFNFINQSLEGKQYFLGDEFSLADIYFFVILRWAMYFKFNFIEEWPNIHKYFTNLSKRSSIREALTQEGLNQ